MKRETATCTCGAPLVRSTMTGFWWHSDERNPKLAGSPPHEPIPTRRWWQRILARWRDPHTPFYIEWLQERASQRISRKHLRHTCGFEGCTVNAPCATCAWLNRLSRLEPDEKRWVQRLSRAFGDNEAEKAAADFKDRSARDKNGDTYI